MDENNISALNLNADASEGTDAFLQLINKWWNIVNHGQQQDTAGYVTFFSKK